MTEAELNELLNNARDKCYLAQNTANNIFYAKEAAYYGAEAIRRKANDAADAQYCIEYDAAYAARDASKKE